MAKVNMTKPPFRYQSGCSFSPGGKKLPHNYCYRRRKSSALPRLGSAEPKLYLPLGTGGQSIVGSSCGAPELALKKYVKSM